ncbi:hypothetical protein BDZ94DRAFT_1242722 [Collybia nuda]|uniref:MYND-type domain-containing protein n=1 Tax=Collybia nuda TaxID=64659 RepID=A0A9P5YGN2_9AGAR|nr:hypothetical protein BDZ94DRAFT_1242722 [Collybia nuda]
MSSTGHGRKTIFDVHWRKPYVQETVEGCAFCRIAEGPGERPFPLCSGCRVVRFCTRDHQVKYWPEHKEFCKHQNKINKTRERFQEKEIIEDGLPTLAERKRILEDWIEVHRHGIEEAVASAIYVADPPFDFKKQVARFGLEYHAESGGNPATAYILRSLKLVTEPRSSPLSTFRGWVKYAEDEEKDTPGYAGHLLCDFTYSDEIAPWLTAMPVFKRDLRTLSLAGHMNWLLPLHFATKQGVVYRLIGPNDTDWTPGLIERQDSKHWVWKPKTLEELKEKGIEPMSPETRFEF